MDNLQLINISKFFLDKAKSMIPLENADQKGKNALPFDLGFGVVGGFDGRGGGFVWGRGERGLGGVGLDG
jgi:hypothetical protein